MLPLTTLKMSLFSAFATLFLLVAMQASTGTASAHTLSSQAIAFHPHHPYLAVYDVMSIGGGCEEMFVTGYGFAPGPVTLMAHQHKHSLDVQPASFFTFRSFKRDVIVCGGYGWRHASALIAIDAHGNYSNPAFLY
jgi:hypothetical protein